jgi:hypothetical protein
MPSSTGLLQEMNVPKKSPGIPKSFADRRDAELFKIDFQVREDPSGMMTPVSTEALQVEEFQNRE